MHSSPGYIAVCCLAPEVETDCTEGSQKSLQRGSLCNMPAAVCCDSWKQLLVVRLSVVQVFTSGKVEAEIQGCARTPGFQYTQ